MGKSYFSFQYSVTTGFHEPFGCGSRTTYAQGGDSVKPMEINVVWSFHHVNMLIDCLACFEEGASVGAFLAADEEDGIVAGAEVQQGGHAVGDLAADGVVIFERGGGVDVLLYVSDDVAEVVEGFCGLGEQADVARKVQLLNILKRVKNNRRTFGLSDET